MTRTLFPIANSPRLADAVTDSMLDEAFGVGRAALHFQPHEHLFLQGDRPKGVFQVKSGTVILYKVMADGRRQIQDFSSAGDLLALTFADEHDLSAEALTDVTARFVPQAAFDRALQDDPHFRRTIFTVIGDMLQASREQTVLLGRKNAMERTASFLLFLESRFADPETGFADIRMSRNDIADYLGLTFETVSRMMNRLKRASIIDLPQPNSFRVTNGMALRAQAGEAETQRYALAS